MFMTSNISKQQIAGRRTHMALVEEVLDLVRSRHVRPVDEEELVAAALNGMLECLDPHSVYLTPQEHMRYEADRSGDIVGVGIHCHEYKGRWTVTEVFKDLPASEAGIQVGDVIIAIDSVDTKGKSMEAIVHMIRGQPGTTARFLLERSGCDAPLEVPVLRCRIDQPLVVPRLFGSVAYIKVCAFTTRNVSHQFLRAIRNNDERCPREDITGFIVDVRCNPGGIVDQAAEVASVFLDPGDIIGQSKGQNNTRLYKAGGMYCMPRMRGKPLILLINGATCSASEIVACAWKENERAFLIGSRSFGKCSWQSPYRLQNGGALKLTESVYYGPHGYSPQGIGIETHIEALQNVPDGEDGDVLDGGESSLDRYIQVSNDPAGAGTMQTYVPLSHEDDTALQLALGLMRGDVAHGGYAEYCRKLKTP